MRRFLLFLNILALAGLWAVCGSTAVEPETCPRLALLGLGFPFVLLVNVAFVPLWALFGWRRLWVPVVGMALVGSYILDYVAIGGQEKPQEGDIKVITYNCHYYGTSLEDSTYSPFDTLVHYLAESHAHIICLQEAPKPSRYTDALVDTLTLLGYDTAHHSGQMLFSRLPIVARGGLTYPTRGANTTQRVSVGYEGDTIEVLNNHFESDAIDEDHQADYTAVLRRSDSVDVSRFARSMVALLAEAVSYRGRQVDTVADYVEHATHPVLLMGDFNDTPISYAYQRLARCLKPAFRESGRGVGLTYRKRKFPVRIDHIFVPREAHTRRTVVARRMTISDHYPVETWVSFRSF